MLETERSVMDELQYFFVVKQAGPDESVQLTLSSYAPFREDQTTIPFDSEVDAAQYILPDCSCEDCMKTSVCGRRQKRDDKHRH